MLLTGIVRGHLLWGDTVVLSRLIFCCAVMMTGFLGTAFMGTANAQGKSSLPASGSNCETLSTCHSECSAGNQASCVREGKRYRDGFAVTANKTKAAAIFKKSCDTKRHPRACMEYAWLSREGWMFEVARDAEVFQDYTARAETYAAEKCPIGKKKKTGEMDACLVGAEVSKRLADLEAWPDIKSKEPSVRTEVSRVRRSMKTALANAKGACAAGHGKACQWLVDEASEIERHGYWDKADSIEKEAKKGFDNACEKGDSDACNLTVSEMLDGDLDEAEIQKFTKLLGPACKRGNGGSCFIGYALVFITSMKEVEQANRAATKAAMEAGQEPDSEMTVEMQKKIIGFVDKLFVHCGNAVQPEMGEVCDNIADMYLGDEDDMEFGKMDSRKAVVVYQERCANGLLDSCNKLAEIGEGNTDAFPKKNAKLVLEASRKICSLSPVDDRCDLCAVSTGGQKMSDPKAPICRTRLAWKERVECDEGKEERCEVLATMYQEHDGVAESLSQAVGYYRLACDSALKSSCSKLKVLCDSNPVLSENENCNQSLIHTDVFYEAEWQFRQSGSAKVLQKGEGGQATTPTVSASADISGGGGLSLKRGSLDADLVVSIVLDRARQAAIRLVVRELKKASRGHSVPIYLEDLMVQASLLLSDESSMRQEKFQDLAMTVVRAFVASNLTQTVFATNQAILKSAHWARWASEAKLKWDPSAFNKSEIGKLRSYLTNWVYYGLSATKLFGRPGEMKIPSCPFRRDASKVVCQLLSSGVDKVTGDALPNLDRLTAMLKIDAMLEGLSLAKALREQGSIDLRRLIEAIGQSKTIADFRQTPGLNLEQWKKELANATEIRLRDMRAQLKAARAIFTRSGWNRINNADDLKLMRERALILVGKNSPYLSMFDSENILKARGILKMAKDVENKYRHVSKLEAKLEMKGGFSFGGDDGIEAATAQAEITLASIEGMELVELIEKAIVNWDESRSFLNKVEDLRGKLKDMNEPMVKFRRSIVEIETILSRYKPPRKIGADITVDVEASFEIAHVPLYALPELLDQLKSVATNLKQIDAQLAPIFPGTARPKLKFAVSAVVRLLGFLDMMERVARTARLNQTCGDVMNALRLLGKVDGDEFTAPLFDVMDPILHAIKTHEPMNVDLLFTIISEVRLDSLISSLADNAEKPCDNNDGGYECWTFKIIHSLQESVKRSGGTISLDGGAFAKRLASHGDDFRRKHQWRGYFHLTVGLGGLYSNVPDAMQTAGSDSRRTVPLVGEQIGFGWASPTFWDDAMTFKTGVYGSGILYRAALDSSESNAIMVSPFIALDVFDLVELYAGPMALFYPPTDTSGASLEWGAAAGVTVPLSSYLDRL